MVVSFSPSMFAVSLTLTSLLPIECPIEIVIHPERIYWALFAEETRSVHFHLFPRTRWLLSQYAASPSADRDISGPQLLDWTGRTFHPPASADYDQLNEAIFRGLTPNV